MDKLWAPWRSGYLAKITKQSAKVKGCLFCHLGKSRADQKNMVVVRRETCYAVLNIYPYNNGHTLIVPYRHVADISKLDHAERSEFFDLMDYTKTLLGDVLRPEGFNIGMNIGKAAGAGIPGHLHMHVVPRWLGDVNFMSVVADTKVISQSLEALYRAVVAADRKRSVGKGKRA